MVSSNSLSNMLLNIKPKFSRFTFNLCLGVCTFVNINSSDNGLNKLFGAVGKAAGMVFNGNQLLNIIGNYVFTGENHPNVPDSFTKPNICILFHGLGGSADEIINVLGDKISSNFNCDVISLEYNNFAITNISGGISNLVTFFRDLRNNKNLQNHNLIIIGYSLGVNIAALFAIELKKLGIDFDFIGYKGYKDLYSVIKTDDGIVQKFTENFLAINKDNVCSVVKGVSESNNEVKKVIEKTDNVNSIKNLGLKTEILNEGLAEGHKANKNDIAVIYAEYEKLKNGDPNKHFILLCQAQKDNIVGSGMQEVYNELSRTGTDSQKEEEDSTAGACDCYSKCGQNNGGSQGSKSSTKSN